MMGTLYMGVFGPRWPMQTTLPDVRGDEENASLCGLRQQQWDCSQPCEVYHLACTSERQQNPADVIPNPGGDDRLPGSG